MVAAVAILILGLT
jgi:hypothetical protein